MSVNGNSGAMQWEESLMTPEHSTLAQVAYHLETYAATKDTSLKEADLKEDAQLLMSLLSSQPQFQELAVDQQAEIWARNQGYLQRHGSEFGSFSFTCPAMSLERNCKDNKTSNSSNFKFDSKIDSTNTAEAQPSSLPAVLLKRTLHSESPSALRASAESIGRNMLCSFQKTLEWRIQVWTDSLSRILVQKEQDLKAQGASQDDLRELLKTNEAKVIASLRMAASQIELIAARTSFHVLPQRADRSSDASAPPTKKAKVEEFTNNSLASEQSSYTYRVSHGLSFETVIDLKTPAGYTAVTIEAPGVIEGTFLSSDNGQDLLTDVKVQIDCHVLATMMERSSRVVAKSASQAIIVPPEPEPMDEDKESELEELEEKGDEEAAIAAGSGSNHSGMTSPQPYTTSTEHPNESARAAIVTPRHPSPPSSYTAGDSDPENSVYFPLPNELEADDEDPRIRMVSPQPRSPDLSSLTFAPRTPTKQSKITVPTLVSPRTTQGISQQDGSFLPSRREAPRFPSLVEAACAAMQHTAC